MELYVNSKQPKIIDSIQNFLDINKKTIILKNTNTTDCANIGKVANQIQNYLNENGLNVHVGRYFNGKTLSDAKLEILDNDTKEPLYVYVKTRKKVLNKRVEREGNFIREFIDYKYNLSMEFEALRLW